MFYNYYYLSLKELLQCNICTGHLIVDRGYLWAFYPSDLPAFVQVCLQVLAVNQVVDEVIEVVMLCLSHLDGMVVYVVELLHIAVEVKFAVTCMHWGSVDLTRPRVIWDKVGWGLDLHPDLKLAGLLQM